MRRMPRHTPVHKGAVKIWVSIGVVWLVVVAHAMIRWVTSDTEFAPAPVLSPDVVPPWNLLALRTFEGCRVNPSRRLSYRSRPLREKVAAIY